MKNVAREATNVAKEEAKKQDLTPEALKTQGQQTAQDLGNTAKAEVHEHEPEFAKR